MQYFALPEGIQYVVCLRHPVPVKGTNIASSGIRTSNQKARRPPLSPVETLDHQGHPDHPSDAGLDRAPGRLQ